MATVGVFLAVFISEPRQQRNPSRGAILERSALFPSLVLSLSALSYGSIVSFFPLYAGKKGIFRRSGPGGIGARRGRLDHEKTDQQHKGRFAG
jgi:hypothetical protein